MVDENQTQEANNTPEVNVEELAIAELEKDVDEGATAEGEETQNAEAAKQKEEKPAEEAAAEPEDDKTSKTQLWSRITQQDKAIRELKQQLKGASSLDAIKEQARKDPAKFLESIGFGVDQVLDVIAGQQGVQPTAKPEAENTEVGALKREIEDMKRYFNEQKQISMVTSEINHIDATIKAAPERWEAISAMKGEGSYNLVIETASELYKQTGKLHDYEYVLDAVEEHLENELRAKYEKLSGLKKLQKQQEAQAKPVLGKPVSKSPPVINPNKQTQVPGDMTEEERLAYAIQVLNSQEK